MHSVFKSLTSSQGLRSATILTVGNVGSTVIAAVAMIIFSRLLGPSDFGIFSVLFSLLLILSKIGDMGINTAVQREVAKHKTDEQYLTKVVRTGSYLKLLVTLGIVMTGLIAGNWIGLNWLQVGQYSPLVPWIFALSGGVIFYEYVTMILQGKEQFGLSIVANLVQALGKLIFAGIFLLAGISMAPVIILYTLAPLVGGLSGLLKLPVSYFIPKFDSVSYTKVIAVAKWTSIAIISATIADNLDVILVQNYLSSYETGLWAAAARIAAIASLIGWSLGTVLNVRVAGYHDRANLRAYLTKGYYIAILSLVGISALSVVSSLAIRYTVGVEFLAASVPLNLLFVSTGILAATTPFIALFYLFDRTSYFAISGIISTVVLLLADVLLIPSFGLLGAGYARIATRLAVLLYTLYAAKIAYQEKYGK